jgi:hypothetical protein
MCRLRFRLHLQWITDRMWSGIIITALIASLHGSNCNDFSFVLDENLQKFRFDLLTFQGDSMRQLDRTFFSFYNALSATLNSSILQPYITLREQFNESCGNFPLYNLEPYPARRLINICDEADRFIESVLEFPDEIIKKFYPEPETLSSTTLMELFAEDYFTRMTQNLQFIVPTYHQNPRCVLPLLKLFMKIYQKPVQKMIQVNEKMLHAVERSVKRDLKWVQIGVSTLFGVANRMENCSDESVIDTYDCVEGFVGYNCLKWKSFCGPVYKSIFITKNRFKKIRLLYSVFEEQLREVDLSVKLADGKMSKWTELLDKCLP